MLINNNLILEKDLLKLNFDLTNNYEITKMCNIKIEHEDNLIPKFKCPDSLDSYTYLKKLCIDGLKKIFGNTVNKIYVDRLKKELEIINKMGFCNYFLIVWDYVKYAKENSILVGPGRGSAASSLVAYVLNITTIDPIKYNLLFERFLNPERITMPDIDIDFEYRYRDGKICNKQIWNKKCCSYNNIWNIRCKTSYQRCCKNNVNRIKNGRQFM